MAWAFSNLILSHDDTGKWYTADYDNSNVGYSYLTFNSEIDRAAWTHNRFKEYLKVWAGYYNWQEDGHIEICEKDEVLIIPDNFKEIKGIETH